MPRPLISIDGQSNADGTYDVASTAGYPGNGYAAAYSRVLMMERRANDSTTDPPVWQTRGHVGDGGPIALSPRPGGTAGLFGVELKLFRDLDAAGILANCSKTSIRGSGLYNNWGVNVAYPSVGPNVAAIHRGDIKEAELAMDSRLVGCIRLQGEADANNQAGAAAWAANEEARVARLRQDWPDAWYILVMIHSGSGGNYNATVRDQQQLLVARIPRARIIDASDLAIIGAHYTADSTIELGRRLALEVQAIWTPTIPRRKARPMNPIPKSTPITSQRTLHFVAVDVNNLQTRLTGLAAFTVRVKKPGASVDAPGSNLPAQVSAGTMPGLYSLVLSTGETDTVGPGVVRVTHSGMEPREFPYFVEDAVFGTVQAGTLTNGAFTSDLRQVDDYWTDALVRFVTGGLAGQVKKIGSFEGSNGLITLASGLALTDPPVAGDIFEILTR